LVAAFSFVAGFSFAAGFSVAAGASLAAGSSGVLIGALPAPKAGTAAIVLMRQMTGKCLVMALADRLASFNAFLPGLPAFKS
jgi:hypothetical protein